MWSPVEDQSPSMRFSGRPWRTTATLPLECHTTRRSSGLYCQISTCAHVCFHMQRLRPKYCVGDLIFQESPCFTSRGLLATRSLPERRGSVDFTTFHQLCCSKYAKIILASFNVRHSTLQPSCSLGYPVATKNTIGSGVASLHVFAERSPQGRSSSLGSDQRAYHGPRGSYNL